MPALDSRSFLSHVLFTYLPMALLPLPHDLFHLLPYLIFQYILMVPFLYLGWTMPWPVVPFILINTMKWMKWMEAWLIKMKATHAMEWLSTLWTLHQRLLSSNMRCDLINSNETQGVKWRVVSLNLIKNTHRMKRGMPPTLLLPLLPPSRDN